MPPGRTALVDQACTVYAWPASSERNQQFVSGILGLVGRLNLCKLNQIQSNGV